LRLYATGHEHLERPRVDDVPLRKKRRGAEWDEGDAADLRARLERAATRAKEAEEAAQSLAASLQQATNRLEAVERQSSDERVAALKEALRRSEAERAMLRAGRPETQLEAEVRELRARLRESQALAKGAEALAAGRGDLSAVQEQLATAARQVDEAVERAKVAEGRADAAEDRAQAAGDTATAAEQRIDLLEVKIQEIAASGLEVREAPELVELQRQLAHAREHAIELEERATRAEGRLALAGSLDGPAEELLRTLEQRVVAAEARATEAEERVRVFEEQTEEGESSFRHRLGVTAAVRKLAAPPPKEDEPEPEMDLRAAIARSLRAPLTRASGLTLSLQGITESSEGKNALRQLSSSLRRLDQLTADLYDVHRIIDGSLPLKPRRTDLAALLTATVEDATHLEDRLVRLDADPVSALVDPVRVRQIVEGMLDAARERTRSGASIVVKVRETETGARVSVEDDNRIPATIGTEMSLAARIAEIHGTEITADGSSFRIELPKDER
jgi:chromosome segregation ATPase